MDIALGVSTASPTVRMVLTEGENAAGPIIEQEIFDVPSGQVVSDHVVTAIRQARHGAAAAGHRLSSVGVAFSDAIEGDLLRDALTRHRVDDVMVVSAFLAAVALAQSAGSAAGDTHTALLYVTPTTATVATVSATDGAIADVHRHRLGEDDLGDELAELVACVDDVPAPPTGVLVVGSGVSLADVAEHLTAATSLRVDFPDQPELALARGAALASAHAPLFASSTQAMAWAQDFGTGSVDLEALRAAAVASPMVGADYGATSDNAGLAYSALPDSDYPETPVPDGAAERLDSAQLDFHSEVQESRNPIVLAVSGAAAVAMIAIAALVVSVVAGDGSSKTPPPRTGAHAVPSQEAAPPKPEAPPSPKPEAPPQAPEAPAPEAPAPQAPAPAPQAPAPAPQAPAVQAPPPAPAAPPAPPPPPQLPVFVPIPIPGAPDIGGPGGPKGRDKNPWSPPRGSDRGHGHDDDDHDWSPKLPFVGGDDHGHGKLKIPGIPGF